MPSWSSRTTTAFPKNPGHSMRNCRQTFPRNTPPAGIMARSKLFRDYQRAFTLASGLRLVLRSAESTCYSSDGRPVSVPVRIGHRVIALLQIEHVNQRTPGVEKPLFAPIERARNASHEAPSNTRPAHFVSSGPDVSLRLLLDSFAPQLAEWYLLHSSREAPCEPTAVLCAKKWLEAHYHEPVTMAKVAQLVKLSPEQFCRCFHRDVGTTFTEFLARARIARVQRLLANPRITIREAAFAAGFQSISQFNRIFSRFVGQSPTRYCHSQGIRRPAPAQSTYTLRSSDVRMLRATC